MKVRTTPYFKIKKGEQVVIALSESFGFEPKTLIIEAMPNKNAHIRLNAIIEEGGKDGKSNTNSKKN